MELMHQSRFAHPGLAGNQHELRLASDTLPESMHEPCQLLIPAVYFLRYPEYIEPVFRPDHKIRITFQHFLQIGLDPISAAISFFGRFLHQLHDDA
ncbi:hypothetical protein D3C81_1673230 [compost metagenome]